LWPPAFKPLLYLVFKVQLRVTESKVPFQPSTCQYPPKHFPFKPISSKVFNLCAAHFLAAGASNFCTTRVSGEKFEPWNLTPTLPRKIGKKYTPICRLHPANPLNLTLTTSTEKEKQNAIFSRLDDFGEVRSPFHHPAPSASGASAAETFDIRCRTSPDAPYKGILV